MPIPLLPEFDADGYQVEPTTAKINEVIAAVNAVGSGGGGGAIQFSEIIPAQGASTNLSYVIGRVPASGLVTAAYLFLDGQIIGNTATAWRLDVQRSPAAGGEYTTIADADFVTGTDIEAAVQFTMVLADESSRTVTEGQYVSVWNRNAGQESPRCLVSLIIEPS